MKLAICAVMAGALLAGQAALAEAKLVTDAKGMTLYTFDKDVGGKSVCYDDCAKKWPAWLVAAGEKMGEGWTMVDRTGGTKQWAYDGKPVYTFAGDVKKGDTLGNGLGGVWHEIKE